MLCQVQSLFRVVNFLDADLTNLTKFDRIKIQRHGLAAPDHGRKVQVTEMIRSFHPSKGCRVKETP